MDLAAFLAVVDAQLDPDSESSVRVLAPQLSALGCNRRLLADAVERVLPEQGDNPYVGGTIILARRPRYVIRLVAWPARTDKPRTPLTEHRRIYNDERMAHTHPFALLTYGCLGPGYFTDRYACDPQELARASVGDPVTLGEREVVQLTEGGTLFYPADRMAHVQHPPEKYSLSLNLMVLAAAPKPQYFVDPVTRTLADAKTHSEP